MRIAATVALLGIAVVLLCLEGHEDPRVLPVRGAAASWEEALGWSVLCPRGTGTSPVPLIAFATPGWLGSVEVTLEAPGRTFVCVTEERSLPWPEQLRPLAVGEWCAVMVAGARGRSAEAAYLRIALTPENSLFEAYGGPTILPDSATSGTMPRARER
jgi:hypothetical protein